MTCTVVRDSITVVECRACQRIHKKKKKRSPDTLEREDRVLFFTSGPQYQRDTVPVAWLQARTMILLLWLHMKITETVGHRVDGALLSILTPNHAKSCFVDSWCNPASSLTSTPAGSRNTQTASKTFTRRAFSQGKQSTGAENLGRAYLRRCVTNDTSLMKAPLPSRRAPRRTQANSYRIGSYDR